MSFRKCIIWSECQKGFSSLSYFSTFFCWQPPCFMWSIGFQKLRNQLLYLVSNNICTLCSFWFIPSLARIFPSPDFHPVHLPFKVSFFNSFGLDLSLCTFVDNFPANFPKLLLCHPLHTLLQEEKEKELVQVLTAFCIRANRYDKLLRMVAHIVKFHLLSQICKPTEISRWRQGKWASLSARWRGRHAGGRDTNMNNSMTIHHHNTQRSIYIWGHSFPSTLHCPSGSTKLWRRCTSQG